MNYVDITENTPVILSLCSGFGGLERGIERAIGKLKVAAYVEIEAFIIENILSLMEQGLLDPAPVWSDLKTFKAEAFREKIHGITGGYPCQPFSHAGNRKGTEDPRHLWPYIQQIVSTTRPVWCFFENVSGHLSLGFDEVYRSLSDMGYRVEAGIFTAEEVGATHQRERLFILAVANTSFITLEERKELGRIWGKPQSSCKELGNSKSNNQWNDGNRPENGHLETGRSGNNEMGNSTSEGLQKPGQSGERKFYEEDRKGVDNRPEQSSELAYTNKFNVQRDNQECAGKEVWQKQGERQARPQSIWPAGPGLYQHDWEEPRTVKPGMGCTINGYNFREDLLRMFGNGVVEQTAEIAFIELTKKIFK